MEQIGTFEAKNKLSELIDKVEMGKEFIITRRGKPVAKLSAIKPAYDPVAAREAYEWIKANRFTLGPGLTVKDLINEGRKW